MSPSRLLTILLSATFTGNARAGANDYQLESIEQLVSGGGRVDWSPDGEWIAFDYLEADGFYDVHIIRPDGTGNQCLTCDYPGGVLPNKHMGQPAFHPNGRYLVFEVEKAEHPGVSDGSKPGMGIYSDLWVMDLEDGSDPHAVYLLHSVNDAIPSGEPDGGVLHAAFSHDGGRIIWADMEDYTLASIVGKWRIAMADFVVDPTPRLANKQFFDPGPQPDWFETHGFGPDDSWIYFACTPTADMVMWNADICRMDFDNPTEVTRMTFTAGVGAEPAAYDEHAKISPRGDVFTWGSDAVRGRNRMELWIANLDGSSPRRVTHLNDPEHPHHPGFHGLAIDHAWNPAPPAGKQQLALLFTNADEGGDTVQILTFDVSDAPPPVDSLADDLASSLGWTPLDYAQSEHWGCTPDNPDDPCSDVYRRIEVAEDLSEVTTDASFEPESEPPVDCFYIYPTLTFWPLDSFNAPAEMTELIRTNLRGNGAPLSPVCRVFAPIYRQMSLYGYGNPGDQDSQHPELLLNATADVFAAWEYYLGHWNDGRPVVILGHSQGAMIASYLLHRYFDGDAPVTDIPGASNQAEIAARLVTALPLGGAIFTAPGALTGGSFAELEVCAAEDQVGCVHAFRTGVEGHSSEQIVFAQEIEYDMAYAGMLNRIPSQDDVTVATDLAAQRLEPGARAVYPCDQMLDVPPGDIRVLSGPVAFESNTCDGATGQCRLAEAPGACGSDLDCTDVYRTYPSRYTATVREIGGLPGLAIGLHLPAAPTEDQRGDPFAACNYVDNSGGMHVLDFVLSSADITAEIHSRTELFFANQPDPDDGGPADDGGSVDDGGPVDDGGGSIDDGGTTTGDADNLSPGRPTPRHSGDPEGCSSSTGMPVAALLAAVLLWMRRRRAGVGRVS